MTGMSLIKDKPMLRRMPAEWEPHRRCWMGWPLPALWGRDLEAVERDYAAVAQAVARFEPVVMLVDPSAAARARRMLGEGVEVVEVPMDDAWLRDSGPSFVEEDGRLSAVTWRFNGWGGANPEFGHDAALGAFVAGRAGAARIPSALAMEGGAIAVDGAGTLLTTDTVAFNANRNPGLSRDLAEAEFARTLGVSKVIWLPGSDREFGTDGHIDGMACFVRPGVALFERAAPDGPSHAISEANRRALDGQTDAQGRPIEIIYMDEAPAPHRANRRGDWGYCLSYVNFYIANGGIVMPRYGVPQDDAAREIVAHAFPDREVVQVDITTLAGGGGGIHCITQQEPFLPAGAA